MGLLLHSFPCVVPEQSHRMLVMQEWQPESDPLSSFGEHGQTVGDMNKSHKTDTPKVGVALSDEPNFFWKTGSDIIKIHNIVFPLTILANICVTVTPMAKGHNTTFNRHNPRNFLDKIVFR